MARGLLGAYSQIVATTVISQMMTTGELSSGIGVDVSDDSIDRAIEMSKAENLAINPQYAKELNSQMRPRKHRYTDLPHDIQEQAKRLAEEKRARKREGRLTNANSKKEWVDDEQKG